MVNKANITDGALPYMVKSEIKKKYCFKMR